MNSNDIKMILDKTNINVLDEINILEYIDELEKVKEEYIKSLDKLDVLENKIDKAIEYMRSQYTITDDDLYLALYSSDGTLDKLENILRGKDGN